MKSVPTKAGRHTFLVDRLSAKGAHIRDKHLASAEAEKIEDLTKSQASKLIDELKLHEPEPQAITGKQQAFLTDLVEQGRDRKSHKAKTDLADSASEHAVTFVNINNHYEGCAPLTIQRFLREL